MILVNQLLNNKSGDSLNLTELVHESVFYLKHIYDPQERVYFDIDIRSDHQIMAK